MAEEIIKVKVPDLPLATTLDGFFAFGVDGSNRSVKTPIEMLKGNEGVPGKSLEFPWSGTKLGIRVAGATTWDYVELRGADGKPFTYDMFTPEQLENLRGAPGETPTTFINSKNNAQHAIWVGTQTEYDAIVTKVETTIYIII